MQRALLLALLAPLAACTISPQDVLFSRDLSQPDLKPSVFDLSGTDGPLPSLCSIANVALCDGFEATDLQGPPWWRVERQAEVLVDGTRPYRGAHSLHIHVESAAGTINERQGEATETLVVPQPDFYFRAFLYYPSPVPNASFRAFGLLQENAPNLGPSLYIRGGKLSLFTQVSTPSVEIDSTTALPLDRWACLEWHVNVGSSGTMEFWIDEQEVVDLRYAGSTITMPTENRITIGFAMFGQPNPMAPQDLWWDEVILDSHRVGCSR
jgi:hypothetical protein